jgi:hypothetical protein
MGALATVSFDDDKEEQEGQRNLASFSDDN